MKMNLSSRPLKFMAAACLMSGGFALQSLAMDTVLHGVVVTMNDQRQTIKNGNVRISGDKITAIWKGPAPQSSDQVRVIDLGPEAMIFPGMINLHDHPHYNVLPLYAAPSSHSQPASGRASGTEPYNNRYEWPNSAEYKRLVVAAQKTLTDPRALNMQAEVLKYAEVKAILAGETAIQGALRTPATDNLLVRNVDNGAFGRNKIQNRVPSINNPSFINSLPTGLRRQMSQGQVDAWLVHLAEGLRDSDRAPGDAFSSRGEFDLLRSLGLLNDATVIIHGTALESADFAAMRRAPAARADGVGDGRGAKLVWSPLSNLLLYGKTTHVYEALKEGILISLGTDWSPSGSPNLLAEMKVADMVLRSPSYLGSDRGLVPELAVTGKNAHGAALAEEALDAEIVAMVTCNPAKSVRWNEAGSLEVGKTADLFVMTRPGFSPASETPYRSLINASERDIRLVFINGEALTGDASLLQVFKGGDMEIIPTPETWPAKAVDITNPSVPLGNQTLTTVISKLTEALASLSGDGRGPGSGCPAPDAKFSYLKSHFLGTAGLSDAAFYQFVLLPNYGLNAQGLLNMEAMQLAPLIAADDDFLLRVVSGKVDANHIVLDNTPPYLLYPANLNQTVADRHAFDLFEDLFTFDLPPGHNKEYVYNIESDNFRGIPLDAGDETLSEALLFTQDEE